MVLRGAARGGPSATERRAKLNNVLLQDPGWADSRFPRV